MSFRFAIEQGSEIGMRCVIHVSLHVAEAGNRTGRDASGPGSDLRLELILHHHAIHQTDAVCFSSVNLIAQEQQLFGFGRARVVREQPGGSEISPEAHLRIRRAELGLIGGDSQIASKAYSQSRAHGESIYRGNRDFGHIVEQP